MQSIHRVWRSRRRSLRLEPLESRRAPATLVSPFQVTYQDADGDRVAVTLSKPLLTPDNVDGVLQFDVGRVDGDNTTRQQLRAIDVRALEFHIPGLSITVMATRGPATGGDGRAPVGRINAGDQELGVVTIDGDLGQLDGGGDPANIPRLRGLAVHSLGRFGLATGAVQQVVTVRGPVAFIRVATDVTGVAIHVGNGNFGGPAGRVGSVFVGGSLIGGAADDSGGLSTEGPLGPIIIRGDLIGGPGFWSGRIDTFARLAAITVGGSVVGGPALESGQIAATAGMGPVVIRGDVVGGAGELSGTVFSYGSGSVSRVAVGGSVRGGTGRASGSVLVFTGVGVVHVGGNLVGGSAAASAGLTDAGMIEAGRITRLTIGGSLIAGTNGTADPFQCNGAIRVRDDIGSLLVRGSIVGTPTNPAVIAARGQEDPAGPADLAIGRLTVLGRVENGLILAGTGLSGLDLVPLNADAQIGPVFVHGDWIASSLAAGAVPGANGYFGDADDAKIFEMEDNPRVSSRVASWTVGGQVLGTLGGTDHYGVVAEVVGVVTVGGTLIPTKPGKSNDDFALGITDDFRVNEV